MVRETRHLWVGNLPDNIREDRIREHFKRYGRVQSVKLLPRVTEEKTGEVTMACTVAFMDIKSASKAHNAELKIDDRTLNTEYYEPAAIPSTAASVAAAAATASGVSISSSPQNNTPSPYSTSSPGTTRFPNGHGSSDEHVPFPDAGSGTTSSRFYERSSSTASQSGGGGGGNTTTSNVRPPPPPEGGAPETANRRTATTTTTSTSYQDTGGGTTTVGGSCRGRTRDRSYRSTNGPFSAQGHRTPSTGVGWSGYESSRFNNSNAGNQSETGYNSTASETNERRNSDQNVRKKAKSRSGTRSPSPSGSTSSRSPSRSRSRSSSSSSTSSTSRDTSTTSSPRSRRHHQHGSSTNQSGQDDRRPVAICVKNLPLRSSDTSLKDGLFHEYKKHGKVTWVKVVGQAADRYAIVCFKKPEDADKALEVSYDKLFFGCKIEVAPYTICDVEEGDLRPYEAEIDEYHPKATRTLFIGNLEKDVTASDLRKHFDQFGEIIEIDIKKQGAVSSYAFCQYSDIVSVVKAIRKMDGEHLGNNRIKLGFGKSMAYNCVWIDGINESVNEKYLRMQFEPFGVINRCVLDRERGQALIFYEHVSHAQLAVSKMRGFVLKNSKLQVDFASRECQECFFERLEKQGLILDRTTVFEDRRDSSSRSFESSAVSRISRYDTPTRPRTSSYSSRSSVAAIQSPGTPGNMTPRGGRSRLSRYDYYDMEYIPGDRHISHRSYDEYSQGSAASHEDPYDPYDPHGAYLHDSPGHLDPLEYELLHHQVRVVQTLVDPVPFAPHDIRNLQKERVHLLEQLEECPSSGDELISPKKRLKLDLLDPVLTSDVIIEANRDHRKVMEVRRLSETTLRHHSRRPSVDSKYKDHVSSSGHYVPHAVGCKRRKTASDGGSSRTAISHSHYVMTLAEPSDGSENGGSRPGTPLCDEKPEFPQAEPRRTPRDREGPLTLPLPKFAAQIMNRGSVSVAGIKGQKDTASILSSPPATSTSPRVSNRPPSPVHVPPPASPPPRPPSLSSNSSDSDITSPSASLEERIRSLDEKYEKWSGSRAISAAGGEALALLDANLEKFRQRHKLLDLDLNEVQPSEIVKSVMAKRSVFDEDLKRLENVGEKYEPKEFTLFNNRVASLATAVTTTSPLSTPLKLAPLTQLPKTPTLLSPRSSGATTIPAAKGLQYPFPSHPPIQMSPVPALQVAASGIVTTATSVTPTSSTSTVTVRTATLGENRLKPCASVPGDVRTSSTKVNVVRNTVVLPTLSKLSEKNNIPNASDGSATSGVLKVKPSDKTDKIMCRRDSNSSSPRADVKTRRNSDTSARRIEDEKLDVQERGKSEEQKREHRLAEKAREAQEKLERESQEKERVEREKVEKDAQEADRLEREHQERRERQERESELEKQRLEKERFHKEKLEKEKERNRLEKNRLEKSRLEKERQEREKVEKERHEKEKQEQEKLERERQKEQERKDREERERIERIEKERREAEEKEKQEKLKKEKEEAERRETEEREVQVKEQTEKLEKEKERKKDEEKSRHKEDNHHDRRKDDSKHRESHSENKHRENNIDKHAHDKTTKESGKDDKSSHELHRRDSHHENSRHDKVRYHLDRETERRKESIKENRDNNVHDRHKNLTETKEHRDRAIVETRHTSIDSDKNRTCDKDPNKRKERNNSLPANLGVKRRMSSHDSVDVPEEKRVKLSHEHKKMSERRDSKDSCKSEDKQRKSKHKNNSINTTHEKHSNSTKESDEKRKEKEREREEKHKRHKLEKQKSKTKSREKDSRESPILQTTTTLTDKDFLAKLNLRSTEEVEREKQRKEHREKRKEAALDNEKRNNEESKKKDRISTDSKETNKSHEDAKLKPSEDKKHLKREKSRKITTSDSDSDEPKKQHSIFDIVDDEPAYISMYDKVKARSCKNMQKQEEEKRQEKIKAKFSQLKLSRARREEKKRSTSWDEDSESGKESSEVKPRRSRKVLDSSDESEDRKSSKRREIYSDSDSSMLRQIKSEPVETTDDEIKNKVAYKVCKSRITSDTSDDEYQKPKLCSQIISEDFHEKKVNSDMSKMFSENENDQGFADTDEKPEKITSVKTELERLIKKERRSSKFQEFHSTENQIFRESHSPEREVKVEKYNKPIFETSDDETTPETRKEKSERREKKHKKKQKKQKHYLNDEAPNKTEMDSAQGENQDRTKHHDKKKDHSRKDKKRDKTREGREKSKKSKKNKSEGKNEIKSDGKMENIFGPLSEDSENGLKELTCQMINKLSYLIDENAQQPHSFNTDSEKEHDSKIKEDRDRENEREEHKKRKEKKRREKERRLQEAAAEAAAAAAEEPPHSNDNSMDFIDMGKQLEANIKDDTSEIEIKSELDNLNIETNMFCFNNQTNETKKDERKESREKKKKRKRSKEERSKHHHHHHHDKNKIKSPEIKKEPVVEEIKELTEMKCQSQSMPTILDATSPIMEKLAPEFTISPSTKESIQMVSPLPKTPTTSKEKKPEKLLPGFGTEIDETIHENAVKSISTDFEPIIKKEEPVIKEEIKEEKLEEQIEDKPRVVISQEETEDAVAALLGESFGNGQFNERYSDEISNPADVGPTLSEENNVQDDEEMRQAVQSLSVSDLDVKPDTPQSEHELQIDTDTEEQDEPSIVESVAKSPESANTTQQQKAQESIQLLETSKTSHFRTTPNISSPPSLTPIKTQPLTVIETKKNLEEPNKTISIVPDQQQRSVISQSQSWVERKSENIIPKQDVLPLTETKLSVPPVISQISTNPPVLKSFATPPTIKISEANYPPLAAITKLSPSLEQKIQAQPVQTTNAKSTSVSQLHNLPARSPVQICKPVGQDNMLSPKASSNINLSRLPITSVMVSKPLQTTTVLLPQPKVAHSMEPPKLVSVSSEMRTQPRMVFQTSSVPFSTFPPRQPGHMILQGNIRHLPPTGLLVPTRHLAPGYAYMGNVPHGTYNNVPVSKELHPHCLDKKQQEDIKISQPVPTCLTNSPIKPTIIMSGNTSSLPTISTTKPPVTSGTISHQIILTCSKPNLSPVPVSSRPLLTMSQSVGAPSSTNNYLTSAPRQSPKSVSVINEPQVSIGAPATEIERPNSSVMLQGACKTAVSELSGVKPLQELDQLSIPTVETPKTSNASPVIVSNPLSSENNSEYKPASPVKLAIEKVTEELNNSLTKEIVEEKEEVTEASKPEDNSDSTTEKSEHLIKKEESSTQSSAGLPVKELKTTDKHPNPQDKLEALIDSKDNKVTEATNTNLFKETASYVEKDISKEDSLDIKEDNDYWSAKEVNIDSVIKTLCSADEMSDHGSESGKYKELDSKHAEDKRDESIETTANSANESSTETKPGEGKSVTTEHDDEPRTPSTRSTTRGRGRGGRRGKGKTVVERGGIQTRQGKLKEMSNVSTTPTKRGRGGRTRSDRTALKSESDSTDVYEFKEESEESNKEQRPRLVLTIKSTASSTNNSQPTAIVKEITKDGTKEIGKEVKENPKETLSTKQPLEHKEEFTSPQSNTRKSRRLAEKDISKNSVDDIIEDVVKNAPQTRASNQRRSGRQVVNKTQTLTLPQAETPRKSPRGRKPRRASEATENSSSEETVKDERPKSVELSPISASAAEKLKEPNVAISQQVEQVKEKPFEGLKAAMLRRIKGELSNSAKSEPTNLIDPVTGLLIPMRESEEGKYIPLPGSSSGNEQKVVLMKPSTPPNQPEPVKEEVKMSEPVKSQQSVITEPQSVTVVQQQMPKIHPFKARVLSSQVAKAVISHQPIQSKPITTTVLSQSQQQQHVISKPITPIVQNKSIPVSQNVHIVAASIASSSSPISPRPAMPVVATKLQVKPPILSPSQQILLTSQKQFIQINKQPPSLQVPKAHISAALSQQAQIVNAQIAHMKQPLKQPQVIIGKGSITKAPHPMHQQQILTGQVASPPLSKSQAPVGTAARIIQGPSSAANKGVMEPPKIDVNLPNVILGRPNLSPQGSQARLPGLPVPGYEASLHGDARTFLNRSRSPPPAHQNSPSPKGEPIFPPGPLRPPDLNPAHYMHPTHVVQYHQFLRQQQLQQQHLQRSAVLEKTGEEGEEAPVGLTLGVRGAAVPHSLHSPHDRATESPQMGQVYNTLSHTARLTPYHPNNRYFDQAEPPPAHRPLTSHSSLAALPGDRGIAHMAPLGTPDRSLSSHLQEDRPLSAHSISSTHMGNMSATERMAAYIERPHGVMGAGLGAAGNLMGAVAKHIGADAPTSQRGLQAATPPHASQVPPQAESLFMLLKHYPLMWQGLLALKNDQAAVQMYSVSGNDDVAKCSLPKNPDESTPPLRIFQRMRLEPPQVEGVARKMQMENEHCMLLALPCGHDHMDVLKQSTNLTNGFITYLQQKQAAGIVNVAAPGTTQPPAYVIHIFPSCDFVNENLRRIAPSLLERVADIAHLLIVITTV
ncbi:protein split ends isoform X2 [Cylas formicarius]|uniref:protein split ends isoform X2 n=1 Tax=Cylas formicarius TaxID=197179 RepID=UPI002958DB9D|nr:protein split ends isoform X2 [Cylas formicarius]